MNKAIVDIIKDLMRKKIWLAMVVNLKIAKTKGLGVARVCCRKEFVKKKVCWERDSEDLRE